MGRGALVLEPATCRRDGSLKLSDEEKKNPRIKELAFENGRRRKQLRKMEEQLARQAGTNLTVPLRTARVVSAFWRSLVVGSSKITDFESALDLFIARGFADLVKMTDDGEVEGMDDAMERLLARYPWLADGDGDGLADSDFDLPSRRTASPPRKKQGASGPTQKELGERMPALRRHGRGGR